MRGQVDYLQSIDNDTFIVGSTVGQVAIYNSSDSSLKKMLVNEGLSVYEMAFQQRSKRMILACDGGLIMIYDLTNFEKIGQMTVQQPDITALHFIRNDILTVGQVLGYLDVLSFADNKAVATHSLQIKEAGDINTIVQGKENGECLIATQKGLLICSVDTNGILTINQSITEYSNLFIVNISWAGDHKYVIITSRPRFESKRQQPRGAENYAVIQYTLFDADE